MALVLTQPQSTITGIPGTIVTDLQILSTATEIVDSIPEANNHSIKWIVTLVDNTGSQISAYEVLATNHFGASVTHNKYGRIGNKIDHDLMVQINAGNIELSITNNEANTLEVHAVRVQTIHS